MMMMMMSKSKKTSTTTKSTIWKTKKFDLGQELSHSLKGRSRRFFRALAEGLGVCSSSSRSRLGLFDLALDTSILGGLLLSQARLFLGREF